MNLATKIKVSAFLVAVSVLISMLFSNLVNANEAHAVGKQVYERTCAMCHSTGAAGAPKLGDTKAWQARSEKGIDVVIANAIKGVKVMPPKGSCTKCTDDEIKATVEYMLAKSL